MNRIKEYNLLENLGETAGSVVYRAKSQSTGNTVILKMLKSRFPSSSDIARLKHEYEIIRQIDCENIIRTHDMFSHENGFVLVLEDMNGISINRYLHQNKKFDVSSFLNAAIQMANGMGELHLKNIIHSDIKPGNVLLNPENGLVKLSDFGIASILARGADPALSSGSIQGALYYVSPEQTGRINQRVDYRTDLYSLGATYYKMITGRVPFESDDPLELIYSHIAREPASPVDLVNDLPEMISEIILKLISKNADDRYQNAFGLMADLEKCRRRLSSTQRVQAFTLGKKDISHKFILPEKLFGRKKEVATLLGAFERIGEPSFSKQAEDQPRRIELVLVDGEPGAGKTALVNEIRIPVARKRGFYLYGKYESFSGDTPYSAILSAFDSLIRLRLTESEEKVSAFGAKLTQALGLDGKVISGLLPELQMLLGSLPDVVELDPNESKNRFNRVFGALVDVLISEENPVVLFLDNLQWADHASLKLIQSVLLKCRGRLLIIGAYRSHEVDASNAFQTDIYDLEKAGVPVTRIFLNPLTEPDVRGFVVHFLKCTAYKGAELAEVIHNKTRGNPFFIHTFLNTLHTGGVLAADPHAGWMWDMDRIRAMNITENVVGLLMDKITSLDEILQEVLKKGACIGVQFDLDTLSNLTDMALDDLLSALDEAMETGFIRMSGNVYQFNHNRIREAAYNLLPEQERAAFHYRIGKYALAQPGGSVNEKLFFITDQLNLASGLITDLAERKALAEMNQECGRKAKSSAAFRPALNYFTAGVRALLPSCWSSQYELALSLHNHAAEAAYLSGNYERMEEHVQKVLASSLSVYDAIWAYETRINAFSALGDFNKSIETILLVLKLLKCRIPKNPGKLRVLGALLNIRPALSSRRIEALAHLPETMDRHWLAVFNMLSYLVRMSFMTSQTLFAYATIQSAKLTLKHGHCKANSANYIGIAILFISVLEDIETGYRLGGFGLELVDRFGSKSLQARTMTLHTMLVAHWKEKVHTLIPVFDQCYRMGMACGDPEYSAQSLLLRDGLGVLTGENLVEIEARMAESYTVIDRLNQLQMLGLYISIWRTVLKITGKQESETLIPKAGFSDQELETLWQSGNAKTLAGIHHVYNMITRYFLDDAEGALKHFKTMRRYKDSLAGTIGLRDYYFYGGLVAAMNHAGVSEKARRSFHRFIGKSIRKHTKWVLSSPENNLQRLKILEAENERLSGRFAKARELYDQGIERARENRTLLEEALANDLAGRFHAISGRKGLAEVYFRDAYGIYTSWGARAKLDRMKALWPDINFADVDHQAGFSNKDATLSLTPTGSASQILDLNTVVKASQTISGEVELGKLLEKMMKITLENAGARKGFMLLENAGNLLVEAEGRIDSEGVEVLKSIPCAKHEGLCPAIVNYVARSGKTLILKDASGEGDFTRDPYIQKNASKSILCSPILNQGKLIGIIYLENNLSAGVFTRERLEILNILSAQMSISIKNAKFYQDLEEKVRERTSQLKLANEQLKNLSFVDPLTRLHNRRYLYEFVSELSDNFMKNQARLASGGDKRDRGLRDKVFGLYLMDIDHFKNVNDTYGHKIGDSVLVSLSNVLKDMIRSDDFLVRWGGEEFLIVLQNISREFLHAFPGKVREAVQGTPLYTGNGSPLFKTCSIGYAEMPFDPSRPELLTLEQTVNLADFALYVAKESGRNKAVRIELQDQPAMDDDMKHYLVNLSKNSKINENYIRLQ